MNALRVAYIVIGLLILILLAYYAAISVKPHVAPAVTSVPSSASYPVMVALADPPYVPNGTQALNLSYSGVRVHVIGENTSQWINSGASGSVDLLSLVNISKVLGTVSVPANSEIDMLAFNVTSLSIFINSTKYLVAVPNGTITVHLHGKVNQSSSIIADFEPTIVTIVTNSSQPVFVLVPSVKAVIIPGISQSAKTGYIPVNTTVKRALKLVAPNISIVSASLGSVGNVSHVSVTVKNNANQSIVLRNLLVFGDENMSIYFNLTRGVIMPMGDDVREMPLGGMSTNTFGGAFNSFIANISSVSLPTPSGMGNVIKHMPMLSHGMFALNEADLEDMVDEVETHHGFMNATELEDLFKNITHNSSLSIPAFAHMNNSELEEILNKTVIDRKMEIEHEHFRVLNFLIAKNGSLVLPFSQFSVMNAYYGGGYVLGAGNTITLSFNGEMTLGNSDVVLTFENGQTYRLVVGGEHGAHTSINITAS